MKVMLHMNAAPSISAHWGLIRPPIINSTPSDQGLYLRWIWQTVTILITGHTYGAKKGVTRDQNADCF